MTDRFLRYSLEHGRKILVVLIEGGEVKRANLTVTSISEDGATFTARAAGKKEKPYAAADVLSCAYARGDGGEIEELPENPQGGRKKR